MSKQCRSIVIFNSFLACCLLMISYECIAAPSQPGTGSDDKCLTTQYVTIQQDKIYLGDLLRKVSQQTGVQCKMDESEPDSGLELSVNLTHVPLKSFMYELVSLLSLQKAGWSWERTADKQSYWLLESYNAKYVYSFLDQIAWQVFRNTMTVLGKMADEDPQDRPADYPALFKAEELPKKDWNKETVYLNTEDPAVTVPMYQWIHFFWHDLPGNVRHQLLYGQKYLNVPLSDVSKRGIDFLKQYWSGHADIVNFAYKPGVGDVQTADHKAPLPEFLEYTDWDSRSNVPCLDVNNYTGIEYAGGPPVAWYLDRLIQELWMGRNDAQTDSLEDSVITTPLGYKAPYVKSDMSPAELHMLQQSINESGSQMPAASVVSAQNPAKQTFAFQFDEAAASLHFSYMAVFPPKTTDAAHGPYGQQLGTFLASNEGSHDERWMHKWHDGVLLISTPRGFLENHHYLPYSRIIKLRLEGDKHRITPLHTLKRLLAGLDKRQVERASAWLSLTADGYWDLNLAKLQENMPDLFQPSGMKINPTTMAELSSIVNNPFVSMSLSNDTRIYVVNSMEGSKQNPVRVCILEASSDDGNSIVEGTGFSQGLSCRPSKASPKPPGN